MDSYLVAEHHRLMIFGDFISPDTLVICHTCSGRTELAEAAAVIEDVWREYPIEVREVTCTICAVTGHWWQFAL